MDNKFRGDLDLEVQIDNLKKQKEYLQSQCRKAGHLINMQKEEIRSLKNIIDSKELQLDAIKSTNEDCWKQNKKLKKELKEAIEHGKMMYEHP